MIDYRGRERGRFEEERWRGARRRGGRNRGPGSCVRAAQRLLMIPYFDILSGYSGSDEKELGYYRHVSPLGVAAQFAWQLFVKGLLRGNVIDGGRAAGRDGTGAFRVRDLANAIAGKREVEEEEREATGERKRGFNKDMESVGAQLSARQNYSAYARARSADRSLKLDAD